MTTPFKLPKTGKRTLLLLLLPPFALCLEGFQGGCSVAKQFVIAPILATHSPAHPQNNQAVTFEGSVTAPVDKIELAYERFSLTVSNGDITQTPAEAKTVVKTCDPDGNVNGLVCTHTMPSAFPAGSLIRFTATAYLANGGKFSETYDFASGDYPLPDDPIPIRAKGDPVDHIDVVFVPDTDITLASFRDQLDEVIEDLYFKYAVFKKWRSHYNFYYSGQQGHFVTFCKFSDPPNIANLKAVADALGFMHQAEMGDCTTDGHFGFDVGDDKTLVHESGHAVFGLTDEYCCNGGYWQADCVPNLYTSLAACQNDAGSVGYPSSNCTQLSGGGTTLNYWRIDPDPPDATGCIMGEARYDAESDFAKACLRRILWRYGKCRGGDCYPSPECP